MDISDISKLKAFNEKREKEVELENAELESFYAEAKNFSDYFLNITEKFNDLYAVKDEYSGIDNYTYKNLQEEILNFSSGLQSIGVKKGDFVCLFSESNGRWIVIDQSIIRCGAISTLRGVLAPNDELKYIINHSGSKVIILQNEKTLIKLRDVLKEVDVKTVILMFDNVEQYKGKFNFEIYSFDEIIEKGKNFKFQKPEIFVDDYYSMLYTSGTTGEPKGAIIDHRAILSQVYSLQDTLSLKSGEKSLEILPVWHAYERTLMYAWFAAGMYVHYTNLSNLRKDLVKYKVDCICSVPRIWETMRISIYQKLKQSSNWKYYFFDMLVKFSIRYKIHKMYGERRLTNKKTKYKMRSRIYHRVLRTLWKPTHYYTNKFAYRKIREAFGLNFRIAISGGGALPIKDQLFYDALGVNLREGYGLTETAPVVVIRRADEQNFLGTAGKPMKGTRLKIVDPETKQEVGMYKKGVVLVKGPQVMVGYYKKEKETKEVLQEGWFNTGDLGWITKDNNLILVGRSKETIVLSNGENIEPVPIESACLESPYIDQIVLVGQDEDSLGALIVPSEDALKKFGKMVDELKTYKNLTIQDVSLRELIKDEINTYIKNKPHLKSFEKIKKFEILTNRFNTENGMLNQTLKLRRNIIFKKYKDVINKMFKKEGKK